MAGTLDTLNGAEPFGHTHHILLAARGRDFLIRFRRRRRADDDSRLLH